MHKLKYMPCGRVYSLHLAIANSGGIAPCIAKPRYHEDNSTRLALATVVVGLSVYLVRYDPLGGRRSVVLQPETSDAVGADDLTIPSTASELSLGRLAPWVDCNTQVSVFIWQVQCSGF